MARAHCGLNVLIAPALLLFFVFCPHMGFGEVLTPPYFNLAENRRITATATCGQDVSQAELYCKLVGANAEREHKYNLIQGQVSRG